jgi:hypothetical protein
MHRRTLFLSPEGDAGTPPPKPRVLPADRYIARYGSAEAAVSVLLQELDASERTAAGHATALENLQKQLPGADKAVMSKADADELAKYRALNLAPEKVTEVITERDTLKGEMSKAAAEKTYREVAKVAGLDEDAFVAHALPQNLPTELRDTQVIEHGKTVTKKVAYIRNPKDDKAPFVAAADYVGGLAAHEQRALKATASSAPTGVPYLEQQPSSGTPANAADAYLSKRFAPRQPAAVTT